MLVYYAHTQGIYNTKVETRDIELLKRLGFEVANPNSKKYQDIVEDIRADPRITATGDAVMNYFYEVVRGCDALAFRALPDGRIPAGVAGEVQAALDAGLPVFEIPTSFLQRRIDVELTKEYLREIGQR